MKMRKRNSALVVGLIAEGAFGYFRDFVFLNINQYLARLVHSNDISDLHPWFAPIASWGYWRVYGFKWFLTLAFIAAFYLLTRFILIRAFGEVLAFRKGLGMLYVSLTALAVLILGVSYPLGLINKLYPITREIAGILQSLLPLLIFAAWGIIEKLPAQEHLES